MQEKACVFMSWAQESYKVRNLTILCMILNDQGYVAL